MSSNERNQELDAGLETDSVEQPEPPPVEGMAADGVAADVYDQALQQEQGTNNDNSPEARLMEAEREVLRARADLENFRKRMQRDADQQLKYANVPLIRDLIEVVDNLNRAVDAASQDATNASALRDGVGMVLSQLATVLGKYGCKPIESVGREFDPNVHEAIAQMASEEHAAGLVSQEVAAGYMLHDRVVRPSTVIVSTGPKA